MPRYCAAQATAEAWLPEECVTTPCRASSSESCRMALLAPRILKEPVRWKFSHLKKSCAPQSLSRPELVRTGVRFARGAMRWAASRMSWREGGVVSVGAITLGMLAALTDTATRH